MKPTPFNDRNGRQINVGDTLKWIRDAKYFTSGPKNGQLKQDGAEFVAGVVVELEKDLAETHGIDYWCRAMDDNGARDQFSGLGHGLRFSSMLEYIEVVK